MKKATAIHQFLAGFSIGDAISNEALVLRSIFQSWGYRSAIFVERRRVSPGLAGQVEHAERARERIGPDDAVLLHLSIGSVINDIFSDLACRKAILYHNITPADYLRGVQEEMARNLAWGREQAASLAGKAEVVMADSLFNAGELAAWGYGEARVMPLFLDFNANKTQPDRKLLGALRDGKINVLFVGRCVPNKRIEDILSAFFFFSRFVMPASRFIHVGSASGMERYHALLLAHSQSLDLKNVLFTGSVSQSELAACYEAAHVFLCMSEHEGFCIPLVESMAHDVPVLAYAAAAVPETMDGAGVLFREKRFEPVSEMMGMLAGNKPFREAVLRGQRERVQRYRRRNMSEELRAILAPLI